MATPGYDDPDLQVILRKELKLSDKAAFFPCSQFDNTPIADHCIGIAKDAGITNILIRCGFRFSGDAIILDLDVPGAPRPRVLEETIRSKGLDVRKTRLVGVCARSGKEDGPMAGKGPEIQVVVIPF